MRESGPPRGPGRNQGGKKCVQHVYRWEELEARLAEKGLRIEARGRGIVVTDGKETVKASSVAPELARGRGASALRHKLDRQLRALRPIEGRALRRSLPIPPRPFVTAALIAARSFAREQGHER